MPVFLLNSADDFPSPHLASDSGLLAIGGDLSYERLISAYSKGIFPWYGESDPVMWWSPDPRLVLFPHELHVSRTLRRKLKQDCFQVSFDTDFAAVIAGCAGPRHNETGTWITGDMRSAYIGLHEMGLAHSVEVWQENRLAGGLYGVSLGACFFGEAMFYRVSDASKAGFVALVRWLQKRGFAMVDCQVETGHLLSFGARPVARDKFLKKLEYCLGQTGVPGKWDRYDCT